MSWIFLEGLDRTGKSSVADMYKQRGFEIVHMEAPNKKFKQKGYAGPSYADEIVDMYMQYAGKDVVFDRSVYGELVWPTVYGRESLINDEEIEMLQEIEDQNDSVRILMFDQNIDAHWKRCVDNNEPLNKSQFNTAHVIWDRVASKYNFDRKQLPDFVKSTPSDLPKKEDVVEVTQEELSDGVDVTLNNDETKVIKAAKVNKTAEQVKLETANAINTVLSKRILRNKGDIFDSLENDIRNFLHTKLSEIFNGTDNSKKFTKEEVQILKLYCNKMLEKASAQRR